MSPQAKPAEKQKRGPPRTTLWDNLEWSAQPHTIRVPRECDGETGPQGHKQTDTETSLRLGLAE
jgi:hypothetical protein